MKKSRREPFKRWKKVIKDDYDFDFSFLWRLELTKLKFMLKFWEDSDKIRASNKDDIVRYLRLAVKLLECIYNDEDKVWKIELSEPRFEEVSDRPGLWRLERDREKDRFTKIGYVNQRNAPRFLGTVINDYRVKRSTELDTERGFPNSVSCLFENDLYRRKAKHLYHLIREYQDEKWWD